MCNGGEEGERAMQGAKSEKGQIKKQNLASCCLSFFSLGVFLRNRDPRHATDTPRAISEITLAVIWSISLLRRERRK